MLNSQMTIPASFVNDIFRLSSRYILNIVRKISKLQLKWLKDKNESQPEQINSDHLRYQKKKNRPTVTLNGQELKHVNSLKHFDKHLHKN